MSGEQQTKDGLTGAISLAGLAAPFVLLEDRLNRAASAWLYSAPTAIVSCDRPQDVDAAFAAIEAGLARGLHAAGFFAYELGFALEPALAGRMPAARDTPLLWFGLFEGARALEAGALDAAFAALAPPPPITGLRAGRSRAEHVAKVEEVLRLIRAGDVYQVNLTFPMTFSFTGPPLSLYGALRARQPVAHAAVVALGDRSILSVSPELFVEVSGGLATARPMKGTVARQLEARADSVAREGLAADPKQRAENLMIVDLIRNDLSRISPPGAVRTPALFTVETYPTFHAMTSTVTARLRPEATLRERVAALFPCGSIVGAPKIRASEIIGDLEAQTRGVYTGAIGVIRPGGDMAFNVAIRTAVVTAAGEGRYGVGGGIVADSDPDAEYDEALLKARVLDGLATDYGLIETFRWSAEAGFVRLAGHLDRLAASARQLAFALDRRALQAELARRAEAWTVDDRRVRLVLACDGDVTITEEAIALPSARVLQVALAAERLDAGDPFLRHKTTRRALFDRTFADAAARGLDEALLLNQDGGAADGSRNSLFVARGEMLATPPLSAGALPGVLRATLIASGQAVEAEITLDDIRRAETWFFGNSLHGLRPARLVEGA